jgi:hypothetical protein
MLAVSLNAAAVTVVNDDFSDGTIAKSSSLTLDYYSSNSSNAGILQDATLNPVSPNNVLRVNADRTAIAPLGQTLTLASVDSITLSFSYRYTSVSTIPALRIGLLNDGGTAVSSNDLTPTTDDYGIYATIGTAAVQGVVETGTNGNIFAGTDRTYGTATGYTMDTAAHQVVATYSLSGSTYSMAVSIDGVSYGSVSSTALTNFNPNELAIVTLTNTVEISNILITTTSSIPESSTYSLIAGAAALGLASFCNRRRRG